MRFVCASDMVDGALDFLGVQHFHNGKLGSIRYAIVSHLNKKVSRFDAIFAKFFAIRDLDVRKHVSVLIDCISWIRLS